VKYTHLFSNSTGEDRINRINYEISTLQVICDKLRCKEIWVPGSERYRNPDEDLPQDFKLRREENLVSNGEHGEKYKDLLYIRRKYIDKDNLRNAIAEIVNAILRNKMTEIWGEGTTSCASDSKRFDAWDQNLMTEWHIRYRGQRCNDLLACG
jgi:hypothetical protein